MLYYASVTSGLVNLATHIIRDLGYGGILAMILCSAVIFVPGTEPVMLFAGFDVYQHHFSLIGIIVFAVLGDLIGATIAYVVGYFGLVEVLDRLPGPFRLEAEEIDRAQRWFIRYGAWIMMVSRWIPVLRAGFPYAGGVAKMAYPKFIAWTAVGSIAWLAAWAFIGRAVGSQWPSWKHHLDYVDYAVVVIVVVGLAYLLFKRTRATSAPA
jgi:membrane protein DedA with SNARE-associated domain